MDKVSGKLTVYFEEPFWVGVFERIENSKLSVAKVTFGEEPRHNHTIAIELSFPLVKPIADAMKNRTDAM